MIDTADENGDISASYRYEAFGQAITSLTPEWGFSSKRFDTAISISYFGARYYDASIGRFISRDPMEYIDGPNQYIYCANNPMVWIDPFGLCRGKKPIGNLLSDTYATDPIRFGQTGYIYQPPPNVVQIGAGYNVGAVTGISKEAGVVIGFTPEDGFVFEKYFSVAGGLHMGVTGNATSDVIFWTNVKSIKDLKGGGMEIAGSYDLGLSVGGGLVTSDSDHEIYGTKISVGSTSPPGTSLGEVHIYKTATIISGD